MDEPDEPRYMAVLRLAVPVEIPLVFEGYPLAVPESERLLDRLESKPEKGNVMEALLEVFVLWGREVLADEGRLCLGGSLFLGGRGGRHYRGWLADSMDMEETSTKL